MRNILGLALAAGLSAAGPLAAATLVVCPEDAAREDCDFRGDDGLPQAADAAEDGDVILIRAGTYSPRSTRDVPFQDLVVRGYVVTENKSVTFRGEEGTILDGGPGAPASAIVARGGVLRFEKLVLRNFRYEAEEDDIYDGHGIFLIGADAAIAQVRMEGIRKMGLSIRDRSHVTADGLQVLDGHIGVWTEEDAELELKNAVFRNNDSAGIAAYMDSRIRVKHAVFDGNEDDGIFARERARVEVERALILRNRPYGARAEGEAVITVRHSAFFGNEADFPTAGEGGRVEALDLVTQDPRVGGDYRPLPGSPIAGRNMGPAAPLW